MNSAKIGGPYVGGDQITLGDIINSEVLAVGREAIAAKGNVTIYKGEAYSRLNYRGEISDFVNFYTKTFVSRAAEITQLINFSARESPGYQLVEALAGFGKTALIFQLLHLYETGIWESHPKPYFLYFFIRQQGNRNTPISFLQAINSQLLDILNLHGGVPIELSALRNQFSELWSEVLKLVNSKQPLLLIVDGFDEMAVGEDVTIADLLPPLGNNTSYIHVIVTSRPNPKALERVSLEHPLRRASVLRLQKFDESDIKALLQKYKASAEIVANLPARVLTITKGEPLFARFVCEDVAQKGESALSQLEIDPPANVEAYFKKQFDQLDSLTDDEGGEIAWEILGLLVLTLGGITIEEMAEILEKNKRKVRKAVNAIQRFLLGDTQLTLMHLQLRKVLIEEFSTREQLENQQKLLNFCAKWQENHSRYALAHYAQHLVEAGRSKDLHDLLSQETSNGRNAWYEAKEQIGETAGYIADVSRAWQQAEKEFNRNPGIAIGRQCRYALITTSVNSLARKFFPELVAALLKQEIWQPAQGLAYVLQSQDSRSITTGLKAIINYLSDFLPEALEVAKGIGSEYYRAEALLSLVPHLTDENLLSGALEVARGIGSEYGRAKALQGLAPHLKNNEDLLTEAKEAAKDIKDDYCRVEALRGFLDLHLTDENLLTKAKEAARCIRNEYYRAEALQSLADHLTDEELSEALTEVTNTNIQDEYFQAVSLQSLAPHLTDENLLRKAKEAARGIRDEYCRAEALRGFLDPRLQLTDENLLREAKEAFNHINSQYLRAMTLQGLAPHLTNEELSKNLETAREINSEYVRAITLQSLAPRLNNENLLTEALEVAREINSEYGRAEALRGLAPHLNNKNLLTEALNVARGIQDQSIRTRALRGLVPHLNNENLLTEALNVARIIGDQSDKAIALNGLRNLLSTPEETTSNTGDESERDLNCNLTEKLSERLEAVSSISNESSRAGELRNLATDLTEELLPRALEITTSISDESSRAHALQSLVEKLLTFSSVDFSLWQQTLHISASLIRLRCLYSLPLVAPLILKLGGVEAIKETIQAVEDVSRWWE